MGILLRARPYTLLGSPRIAFPRPDPSLRRETVTHFAALRRPSPALLFYSARRCSAVEAGEIAAGLGKRAARRRCSPAESRVLSHLSLHALKAKRVAVVHALRPVALPGCL